MSPIGASGHGAYYQTEAQAMVVLLGPFMVLTFCLSQAFRDVYFANIFQGLDLFAVIAIAFGLSAIIFGFGQPFDRRATSPSFANISRQRQR